MNIFRRIITPVEDANEAAENQRRVQLAESYATMRGLIAWRDLDVFMTQLSQESVKHLDEMPVQALTLADAAHSRGIREAIDRIRRHIGFQINEEGQ